MRRCYLFEKMLLILLTAATLISVSACEIKQTESGMLLVNNAPSGNTEVVELGVQNSKPPISHPYDSVFPQHEPYGTGIGVMPGRVVWVHDPDSVEWDGEGYWWQLEHFDEVAIQNMVNNGISSLANETDAKSGWNALFRKHNTSRGKEGAYQSGEKIAIKANMNGAGAYSDDTNGETHESYTNPVLLKALLVSLVTEAGVAPSDITVYDAGRIFPDYMQELCGTGVLEGVRFQYRDILGENDAKADKNEPIVWSQRVSGATNYVPECVTEAEYVINLADLKGHVYGVTLCAKNHFGSILNSNRMRAPEAAGVHGNVSANKMNAYSVLVDLMANHQLGEKTMLYMLDAIVVAPGESVHITGENSHWRQAPFNGDYTSSVFFSQDPIAIDSVGVDFLINEPTVTERNGALRNNPNVEYYLHEAALVANAPSGVVYYNGNGKAVTNLGVHEHWNNSIQKQYSRNLGKDVGIELVYMNTTNSNINTEQKPTDRKILVAYFSRTGNTRTIADYVQELTDGDLFEIVTAKPYPSDYSECLAQATRELEQNFRPAISTYVDDMEQYDLIFIGYPIWWGNTPMAVLTFLEEYDLTGKTVIPFCTYGSSGSGQSFSSVKSAASGAILLDGFGCRGADASGAKSHVKEWLDGLGILE